MDDLGGAIMLPPPTARGLGRRSSLTDTLDGPRNKPGSDNGLEMPSFGGSAVPAWHAAAACRTAELSATGRYV